MGEGTEKGWGDPMECSREKVLVLGREQLKGQAEDEERDSRWASH